jgi:hypothetical protein
VPTCRYVLDGQAKYLHVFSARFLLVNGVVNRELAVSDCGGTLTSKIPEFLTTLVSLT